MAVVTVGAPLLIPVVVTPVHGFATLTDGTQDHEPPAVIPPAPPSTFPALLLAL